jgi:hypothetical protein
MQEAKEGLNGVRHKDGTLNTSIKQQALVRSTALASSD